MGWDKVSKIKILHIIEWIFVVLGLLTSVSMFGQGAKGVTSGIILLISAFVISPLFEKIPFLKNSLRKKTLIQFISAFILFCVGVYFSPTTDKPSESKSSDIVVASTAVPQVTTSETTTTTTTTATSITTTTAKSNTTLATSEKITTATTTTIAIETTTSDLENRTEKFVEDVRTAIEDAVGANEYITDVSLSDNILTISVDLSKADTSIISVEDLAISRAQSITDSFLELEQYDDLWKEIIVDFGDVGYVKRTPNDISKTILSSQTLRYFEINELDNPNTDSTTGATKVEDLTKKAEVTSLKHGELLDVTTVAGPLVIKAKIQPSLTNKLTIDQNYMNVADVILNQGGNQFDEIQYWAVADMTDGSESKVISFTLDKATIDGIYNGNIVDIQLGDYANDLWILPSLKN